MAASQNLAISASLPPPLLSKWPAAASQRLLERIHTLYGQPSLPLPPSVMLHCPLSQACTRSILSDYLSASSSSLPAIARLDPLVQGSLSSCFSRILEAVQQGQPSSVTSKRAVSLDEHIDRLRTQLASDEGQRLVILVDRAERMRDMWPLELWEGLLTLAERLHMIGRISILLVSRVAPEAFHTPGGAEMLVGFGSPIVIAVPLLSLADTTRHMSGQRERYLDVLDASLSEPSSVEAAEELLDSYFSYAIQALQSEVRDVTELEVLLFAIWHAFLRPIAEGKASMNQKHDLFKRLAPHIRDALATLHPRLISPSAWIERVCNSTSRQDDDATPIDLSPQSALLLLASFLASRHTARMDATLFMQTELDGVAVPGKKAKARKKGGALKRTAVKKGKGLGDVMGRGGEDEDELILAKLPKATSLDRIVFIASSLSRQLEPPSRLSSAHLAALETRPHRVGVSRALNALVQLGLVDKARSASTALGNETWRCVAGVDVVRKLVQRAGWRWEAGGGWEV